MYRAGLLTMALGPAQWGNWACWRGTGELLGRLAQGLGRLRSTRAVPSLARPGAEEADASDATRGGLRPMPTGSGDDGRGDDELGAGRQSRERGRHRGADRAAARINSDELLHSEGGGLQGTPMAAWCNSGAEERRCWWPTPASRDSGEQPEATAGSRAPSPARLK